MKKSELIQLIKEMISEIEIKQPKPKSGLKKLPGLDKSLKDFLDVPAIILDMKRDPGYGYDNVFLLQLWFPPSKYNKKGEYGLAIYDYVKKEFIEEPASYESYDVDAETIERKYGFSHEIIDKLTANDIIKNIKKKFPNYKLPMAEYLKLAEQILYVYPQMHKETFLTKVLPVVNNKDIKKSLKGEIRDCVIDIEDFLYTSTL